MHIAKKIMETRSSIESENVTRSTDVPAKHNTEKGRYALSQLVHIALSSTLSRAHTLRTQSLSSADIIERGSRESGTRN